MVTAVANVNIKLDTKKEELIVRSKRHGVPPYFCMVREGRGATGINSDLDARDYLSKLSKTESELFWTLHKKMDFTSNMVKFTKEDAISGTSSTYHRTMKSLIQLGLIKRVAQNMYMLNPLLFMPPFSRYQEVVETWVN